MQQYFKCIDLVLVWLGSNEKTLNLRFSAITRVSRGIMVIIQISDFTKT